MSSPGSRNTVTSDDVETAQAVLEAWGEHLTATAQGYDKFVAEGLPYLRGLITQALADKRGEGHSEGYAHGLLSGRREVAHLIRDALTGEGL